MSIRLRRHRFNSGPVFDKGWLNSRQKKILRCVGNELFEDYRRALDRGTCESLILWRHLDAPTNLTSLLSWVRANT